MAFNYFHLHNGKGDHADGQTYEIVIACDDHCMAVAKLADSEFITETDDGPCDLCQTVAEYAAEAGNARTSQA